MKNIAIDLIWVRVKKVGGTEHYIRNLLDGFRGLPDNFSFILVVAKDNYESFVHYTEDSRFQILTADINANEIGKRLIWQNLFENRWLKKNGIEYCFEPTLFRPMFNGHIKYISTIHDIQGYYYPQYHPAYEVIYSWLCWQACRWHSYKVISTSNCVKKDLVEKMHIKRGKIDVIPIPVEVVYPQKNTFAELENRYHIAGKEYYYTISQLIPHKNLKTLILVMAKIKNSKINLPARLLISGGHGSNKEELYQLIDENDLRANIILTEFISVEEKYSLIENSRAFLFPSVFEGFGMPPVEAMMLRAPVITTKCASIPEVTQNRATYVEDPYDVDEWISRMQDLDCAGVQIDNSVYDKTNIALKYLKIFDEDER